MSVYRLLVAFSVLNIILAGPAAAQQPSTGSTFPEAGGNLPALPVGPEDLLAVSVFGSPEFTRTVRVSAEGEIRMPMLVSPIKVRGLLPESVEAVIAQALVSEQVLVSPAVTVTIVEYRSRPISVSGAVKVPVTFQAYGNVTVLDALTRAQGLSLEAGPEILVSRTQRDDTGKTRTLVQRIPVKGLIDAADPELNLKLEGGEEIRVPEAGKVFVVGNVKKPGAVTVDDANGTTVLKVLSMSEGLVDFSGKIAYIYRKEGGAGGAKNEIPIPLQDIMRRKSPDVTLVANDILYIPDRPGQRATFSALEKILMISGALGSAGIFAATR
jgi:polysaccharide export outer membrane protein